MALISSHVSEWSYEDRNTCQEIVSRVWLGPHSVGRMTDMLETEIGVTDIVYVRSRGSSRERDLLQPRSLSSSRSHVIELNDDEVSSCQRIFSLFVDLLNTILKESERNTVLVLGLTAMNRSASLMAAFLIRTHGMNTFQATQYLMTRRRCIAISPSMRRQLVEFEIAPTSTPTVGVTVRAKRQLTDP